MPAITSKSNKADILAAYETLLAQSQAETITMPAIRNTAVVVAREVVALARDLYRAGAALRLWTMRVVDELSQPVLRSDS